MAKQWYYQVMGSEVGPVSSAELKNRVQKGLLQPDTPVRVGPDGRWQTADKVKGLLDPPPAPAPRPASPVPEASAARANATEGTPRPAAQATTSSAPVTTLRLAAVDDDDEETYHVAGEARDASTAPSKPEPPPAEFDFFRLVGFENALGAPLHAALDDHCRARGLTVTAVTRRALAEHLGRQDLLEESPATAPNTVSTPEPASLVVAAPDVDAPGQPTP